MACNSGLIKYDGVALRYLGLEPVTIDAPIADLVVNADSFPTVDGSLPTINGTEITPGDLSIQFDLVFDDQLVLEDAGGGNFQVRNLNSSMETVIFPEPTNSLTINLSIGDDTLTIADAINFSTSSLIITGDPEDLTLYSGIDEVIIAESITLSGGDLDIEVDVVTLQGAESSVVTAGTGWTADERYTQVAATGGTGSGLRHRSPPTHPAFLR